MSYKDDAKASRAAKMKSYAAGGLVKPNYDREDREMGLSWMRDEVNQRERLWQKTPKEFQDMNADMENSAVRKRNPADEMGS